MNDFDKSLWWSIASIFISGVVFGFIVATVLQLALAPPPLTPGE